MSAPIAGLMCAGVAADRWKARAGDARSPEDRKDIPEYKKLIREYKKLMRASGKGIGESKNFIPESRKDIREYKKLIREYEKEIPEYEKDIRAPSKDMPASPEELRESKNGMPESRGSIRESPEGLRACQRCPGPPAATVPGTCSLGAVQRCRHRRPWPSGQDHGVPAHGTRGRHACPWTPSQGPSHGGFQDEQ